MKGQSTDGDIIRVAAYPGKDARIALELINKNLQLPSKFILLVCIWQYGYRNAVCVDCGLQRSERWHILDDQKTHFVTCTVPKCRLNFNLETQLALLWKADLLYLHACGPY